MDNNPHHEQTPPVPQRFLGEHLTLPATIIASPRSAGCPCRWGQPDLCHDPEPDPESGAAMACVQPWMLPDPVWLRPQTFANADADFDANGFPIPDNPMRRGNHRTTTAEAEVAEVDPNPPLWAALRTGCSRRARLLLEQGWPLALPGLPRASMSLLLALQGQGWAFRYFAPPCTGQDTPLGLRECLRLVASTNHERQLVRRQRFLRGFCREIQRRTGMPLILASLVLQLVAPDFHLLICDDHILVDAAAETQERVTASPTTTTTATQQSNQFNHPNQHNETIQQSPRHPVHSEYDEQPQPLDIDPSDRTALLWALELVRPPLPGLSPPTPIPAEITEITAAAAVINTTAAPTTNTATTANPENAAAPITTTTTSKTATRNPTQPP